MWTFQSNLTAGEIDPQLFGRLDLQAYYNGVQKAQNVLCVPQGGLKKRPGTQFLDEISLTDGNKTLQPPRLESFESTQEERWVIAFQQGEDIFLGQFLRFSVYDANGVLQYQDDVFLGILTAPVYDVERMDYIQSLDTFIITHPNYSPIKATSSGIAAWSIDQSPLFNIPQYDFDDSFSPTPTSQIQEMVLSGINLGERFKLSLNGILTEEITFAGDSNADEQAATEENILEALIDHPLTASTGITVARTAALTYDITFSGDSADDYDLLTLTPTYDPDFNMTGTFTITQAGVSRREDVWSDLRGWPKTTTFHEGRLWFGGSRYLKNTVWGSNVNDFFNFRVGRSFDDNAIIFTLDTDQLNDIVGIFSNRELQIFTSGAEFYVPVSPITPSNVSVSSQTRLGTKQVRPVTLNGRTYFVQRSGKSIHGFIFLDELKANTSEAVSILAPHLINDPIQMAVKRGSQTSDVNYILIVNSDGNMTVYNTVPNQAIDGFTRWEMDGNITSVAVSNDLIHLIVERDGAYYLCRENDRLNTDLGNIETQAAPFSTLSGLDHLNGSSVVVKADNAVQLNETVSGGSITIDGTATTIEAGLEFTALIETMPLNVNFESGPIAAKRKKIGRAALQLFESNGVIVNNQRITDKVMAVNQFNSPEPQTDLRRIYLGGWSLEATIKITQTTPYNMQILSIGMEVFV